MIYTNDDLRLMRVADRDRYAEDDTKVCPVCGTENPEDFYVSLQTDECIGCSDCVNICGWKEY